MKPTNHDPSGNAPPAFPTLHLTLVSASAFVTTHVKDALLPEKAWTSLIPSIHNGSTMNVVNILFV